MKNVFLLGMTKTITINSPEQIKSWLWVIKALSTDATRPAIHHICVDESGEIVATDGERLHKWKPEALPAELTPGVYKVLSKSAKLVVLENISEDSSFPDWKAVVPKDHNHKALIGGSMGIKNQSCCGVVLLETVTPLDFGHVAEALGYGTVQRKSMHLKGATCTWEDDTGKNPVCLFPEVDKQAVIMPLRTLVNRNFKFLD